MTAAVIVCDGHAALRVAGLTVLDRLLVAVWRAGLRPVTVIGEGALPPHPRARALGVAYTTAGASPPGRAFVAATSAVVTAEDVERAVAADAALADAAGVRLEAGVSDAARTVTAGAAAAPVRDPAEAKEATRRLWASLEAPADGPLDRHVSRVLGRPLSRLLVRTPVHPNHVTLLATALGLWGAWLFASGERADAILGSALLIAGVVLDCVDGDLARAAFKESALGARLDLYLDQVVTLSTFLAIGIGLGAEGIWLGSSAALGAVLSLAVFLRGRALPRAGRRIERLVDGLTSRDFVYLVALCALLGRLDLLLWAAAVGAHVFWMLALAAQRGSLAGRT